MHFSKLLKMALQFCPVDRLGKQSTTLSHGLLAFFDLSMIAETEIVSTSSNHSMDTQTFKGANMREMTISSTIFAGLQRCLYTKI